MCSTLLDGMVRTCLLFLGLAFKFTVSIWLLSSPLHLENVWHYRCHHLIPVSMALQLRNAAFCFWIYSATLPLFQVTTGKTYYRYFTFTDYFTILYCFLPVLPVSLWKSMLIKQYAPSECSVFFPLAYLSECFCLWGNHQVLKQNSLWQQLMDKAELRG